MNNKYLDLVKSVDKWHFRAEEMKKEAIYWYLQAQKWKMVAVIVIIIAIGMSFFVK